MQLAVVCPEIMNIPDINANTLPDCLMGFIVPSRNLIICYVLEYFTSSFADQVIIFYINADRNVSTRIFTKEIPAMLIKSKQTVCPL